MVIRKMKINQLCDKIIIYQARNYGSKPSCVIISYQDLKRIEQEFYETFHAAIHTSATSRKLKIMGVDLVGSYELEPDQLEFGWHGINE